MNENTTPCPSCGNEKPAVVMHIAVRAWFDKVNGNSYQSVSVFVDGQCVAADPFRYGRGDVQAAATAARLLRDAGWPVPVEGLGRHAAARVGVAVSIDVVDVQRRKDLHDGGRGDSWVIAADPVTATAARLFADGMALAEALDAAAALSVLDESEAVTA